MTTGHLGISPIGIELLDDPDADPAAVTLSLRNVARANRWFGGAAAVAVLGLTGWERGGGRIGRRWLAAVGDASYSIYLVHAPMITLAMYLTILAGMPHNQTGHLAWLGLMLAAGVGPGLLFHRFVEAPLLRLGKRARPGPAVRHGRVPAGPVLRAA